VVTVNRALIQLIGIASIVGCSAVACSTGLELFGASGSGGGAGSSTGNAPTTSTQSGDPATTTTMGVGAQGGQPSQGGGIAEGGSSQGGMGEGGMGQAGKGQGGSAPCTHDFCDAGPALAANCDPCVTQICAADPYCCNQMWDGICVGYVGSICQIDCFPIGMGPCGMQYPNNKVCSDANNQCELAYDATAASCSSVCQAGGGECLGAFNDVNNQTCQTNPNQPVSCTSQLITTGVCVCSQGCGNGPPCSMTQICLLGNCI
jgi:hypothetical protein